MERQKKKRESEYCRESVTATSGVATLQQSRGPVRNHGATDDKLQHGNTGPYTAIMFLPKYTKVPQRLLHDLCSKLHCNFTTGVTTFERRNVV